MAKLTCLSVVIALVLILPPADSGATDGKTSASSAQYNYKLKSWVIGASGFGWPGPGPVARYGGTLGQPTPVGVSDSEHLKVYWGFWGWYWPWMLTPAAEQTLPVAFQDELLQNFPNPFNPSTTVEYSVSHEDIVEITILNIQGRKVRTLVNQNTVPGRYRAVWDGRDDKGNAVASGVYLCRLQIGSYASVKKMLMLK